MQALSWRSVDIQDDTVRLRISMFLTNQNKLKMKKYTSFISLYLIFFIFTTNIWGSENDPTMVKFLMEGDNQWIFDNDPSGPFRCDSQRYLQTMENVNDDYVVIASPSNNESFDTTTGFTVTVDASHPSGFQWMRLWINDGVYEVKNQSPWVFNVSGLGEGTYSLFVRARDNDGGTTDSEKITITLDHEILPPPADNAIPVDLIVKGPYLVYGNDPNAMTVMWEQTTEEAGTIEWGSTVSYGNGGTGTVSADGLYGKLYKFNITGLTPGEKVYYQVTVNGQSVKSFFYAVRNDENEIVTLYVAGDSRTAPENPGHVLTERVFSRMLTDIDQNIDDRNSMILYTGDMVFTGNSENDWQKWFRPEQLKIRDYDAAPAMYEFFTRMPIMNAIGNHELYANDADNMDWTAAVYRTYFPYNYVNTTFDMANGLYHTFTYGPVRVLILDNMREIKQDEAQYNWIEDVLQNNTHPFVVAIYHRPAYGVGYNVNEWKWMQTDVVPLLQKHGVQLAFNAHDHFYNRSVVDGFHHITTGGLTQPRTAGNAIHSVKKDNENHYCRIEANPDTKTLTVTAITWDGRIIETFDVNFGATNISTWIVDRIKIYPNPVYNDTVIVELGLESLSKVSLSVLDMYGSVVLQPLSNHSYETGTHKLKIPLVNIPAGTYFMQITIDGIRQTQKIIVM